MRFGLPWLPRTVATVLLLLGGVGLPAASASAAPAAPAGTDLTVDLAGGTIPLGVEKKTLHLKISNQGDATPSRVTVRVDASELDQESFLITLWPAAGDLGECDGDFFGWYCDLLPEHLPGPGETVDLPVRATVQAKEPLAGRIKVTVEVTPEDTNPADNTKSFPIEVVDQSEADLSVVAPDVTQSVRVAADGSLTSTGTLNPGETGAVRYTIANQGRKPVDGVKVELRLPAGATFTRPPGECVLGDAGRAAVCTYRLALIPVDQDTDPNDRRYSAVELYHLVTVSAATKAPVTLRNGTVRVEGLSDPQSDRFRPARTDLPANAVAVRAADVDGSDNQDGFAVVVVANSSGGGGGGDGGPGGSGGGGGAGGGGEGDGGGLPITGSRVGLTAGTGLALLLGGGALLLLARRRRAVR